MTKRNAPKRSVIICGQQTSISLEDSFWNAFRQIADERQTTTNKLIAEIVKEHPANLSSAIREFVLGVYRDAAGS